MVLMIRSQPFQFACVSGEGKWLGIRVRGREGLRVLESETPTGQCCSERVCLQNAQLGTQR